LASQEKHSLIYFLGRGIPGLINFLTLSIYTHTLSPEEYGQYALIIAGVALTSSLLFLWLKLSLLRFWESDKFNRNNLNVLSNLSVGFIACTILAFFLMIPLLYYESNFDKRLILSGFIILIFDTLLEICLDYFRANLNPIRYSLIFISKSSLYFLLGVGSTYLGYGAWGVLVSMILSLFLILSIYCYPLLKIFVRSLKSFKKEHFGTFFKYGAPFTLTFSMGFIFNSSDRFFISYFIGEKATGLYSVGYDLARQSLWILFYTISLATYPIIMNTHQKKGVVEAQVELNKSLILFLLIGIPCSFLFLGAPSEISNMIVGARFAPVVQQMLPWIAIGTLILGVKNFYFDVFFQLENKTLLQVVPVVFAAISNIVINLFIIPAMGLMGAVYSSLVSFLVAFGLSAFLSRQFIQVRFPFWTVFKLVVAGIMMLIPLFLSRSYVDDLIFIYLICPFSIIVYLISLKVLKLKELESIFKLASLLKKIKTRE
jgi:O-antigen/teichoic acid export membrane protein